MALSIVGLWPDNCDGTYEQFCDASRESTDIRGVLQNNGQTDLLSYMNVYWKDYQGDDETFWEHVSVDGYSFRLSSLGKDALWGVD